MWIVAKTKGRREKYAGENIVRQGYKTYLPVQHALRGSGKVKYAIAEPVFASYIFVETESSWRFLLSTYGVTSVVMIGDRPAIMPLAAIIQLKRQEEDGFYKPRVMAPGDQIRINSGSYEDQMGIYLGQTQKQRATILMDILGGKRKVQIDYDNIELVA